MQAKVFLSFQIRRAQTTVITLLTIYLFIYFLQIETNSYTPYLLLIPFLVNLWPLAKIQSAQILLLLRM